MVCTFTLTAQVKAPQPSPACKIEQKVGLTDVTLEYSRPGVKGRTIFGDLVPYNKMWRTGANKNSMITFSDDVKVAGNDIAAGSYAIFATPSKDNWQIDLYSDTENWGTPREWDATKVAASFAARTMKNAKSQETFSITVENVKDASADIVISWADTRVAIPIMVPTDEMVMATIERTMDGPSAGDYYTAGRYLKDSGKDYDRALEYINMALEKGGDKFWIVRQKALTLAKMGNTKEAIKAAEKSMMLAKEAGNDDYVRMNEKSIKEWSSK